MFLWYIILLRNQRLILVYFARRVIENYIEVLCIFMSVLILNTYTRSSYLSSILAVAAYTADTVVVCLVSLSFSHASRLIDSAPTLLADIHPLFSSTA